MSFLFPVLPSGRTSSIFAATPLLLCFLGVSLWSQTVETERWPVPMRVDRAQITTGLLVEMNFERLETPYAGFESQDNPDRQVMDQFVGSILTGEIDQAIELTIDTPGMVRENARELLQAFSSLLEDQSETLLLDRIVHQGSDRLLVWSIPNGEGEKFYRSFRFVRNSEGALAYEGLLTEPVSSLLTNVFQIGQQAGPVDTNAAGLGYEYDLPNTEESPVTFHFNGIEIDVDAFTPGGSTQNEIVDFYNASIAALANGTSAQAAAYYSPYSSQRYLEWATEQGDLSYETFRSEMIEYGSRVVFVLDADPMYLVFFLPGNSDVQGDPLRYVSIFKDPDNGLQLTDFYIEGLTETFLRKRQYFEEPFLRPLLISSGTISAEIVPERTIVSRGATELPDPDELALILEEETKKPDPDAKPDYSTIDEIASEPLPWPWILGSITLLAIAALILSQRKRNK